MTLAELALALGADLEPGVGTTPDPGALEITGVAGLQYAGPSEISFLDNTRYTAAAHATRAAAVLVQPDFPALHVPLLRVGNPYLAFARAVELFHAPPLYPPGVHVTAVIDPTAQLAGDVHIGPYSLSLIHI